MKKTHTYIFLLVFVNLFTTEFFNYSRCLEQSWWNFRYVFIRGTKLFRASLRISWDLNLCSQRLWLQYDLQITHTWRQSFIKILLLIRTDSRTWSSFRSHSARRARGKDSIFLFMTSKRCRCKYVNKSRSEPSTKMSENFSNIKLLPFLSFSILYSLI